MKQILLLALALCASTPAFAFTIDFERTWDYGNGEINNYYNGGTAADGSNDGTNYGVQFINFSGLSNDALGPYFQNAPTSQGVAYTDAATAYIDVAAGVNGLLFYYSSNTNISAAITAWSGLDGTGTQLGSLDLTANTTNYDTWTALAFNFNGSAQSFVLSNTSAVLFDNISSVPLPGTSWLLGAGLAMFGLISRRKQAVA